LGNQIDKKEMGGACSTCWKRIGAYRVLMGKVRRRHHLEDPGVDGRIIFRWIFSK
jgi:hypothetical protein